MASAARLTLSVERRLLREGYASVACLDEVGRGALAGPVSIGAVLVRPGIGPAPKGVRDSKLLSDRQRRQVAPLIRQWAPECSIGHATAAEVDEMGLAAALGIAASRALAELTEVDAVLLDGPTDFVSSHYSGLSPISVFPRVKADLSCAGVAAASILAKVARDDILVELAARHPEYGFSRNMGYGSLAHRAALREHGPCEAHRRSFRLV